MIDTKIKSNGNMVRTEEKVEKGTKYQEKEKLKAFRKIGFNKEETDNMVNALNNVLANYHVHYQKLRNYHWNVKGSDFFDIHEKFEIQYNEVVKNIDNIAERIRVFGRIPVSTLKEYLEISAIQETSPNLSAREMVKEIINDYEILLSYLVDTADVAVDNGDFGTEDMIKSFIKKLEKNHWMMSAFLS